MNKFIFSHSKNSIINIAHVSSFQVMDHDGLYGVFAVTVNGNYLILVASSYSEACNALKHMPNLAFEV